MINHGYAQEKMADLLSQQTIYIDKLKREKSILSAELKMFKHRLNSIVEENQTLHENLQSQVISQTIDSSHAVLEKSLESTEKDLIQSLNQGLHLSSPLQANPTHSSDVGESWKQEMHNLKSLYESKIAALEAQIKTTNASLKSALIETEEMKLNNEVPKNFAKEKIKQKMPACDVNLPIIERLTKERDDLLKSVTSLRSSLNQAQVQEAGLRQDLQKSFATLEDIQLEKTQIQVERDQLKQAYQTVCSKLDNEISRAHKNALDAAAKQRAACAEEINDLQRKVGELMASCSHYENDIERSAKEKSLVLIQLDESKNQLIQTEKQLAAMQAEVEHEVKSSLKGYKAAQVELVDAKAKLERELLETKLERTRYEEDSKELHRRLTDAEEYSLKTQQLNVALTEDIHSTKTKNGQLQQELFEMKNSFTTHMEKQQRTSSTEMERLKTSMQQMELEYEKRLNDLEEITRKQANLIFHLKDECKTLVEALNDLGQKHRVEVGSLSQNLEQAKSRLSRLDKKNKELSQQCVEHGKVHHQMQERLLEVNNRARVTTNQVLDLLDRRHQDEKVNEVLNKEVQFLHSHLIEDHNAASHLCCSTGDV